MGKTMKLLFSITFGIAFLLVAASSQAEIYKWKDDNGNWHYSDQPPAGAQKKKASVVNTKDLPVSSLSGYKRKTDDAKASGAASAPAVANEAAKKKVNEQACQAARTRLSFLQNATQMRSTNEKGELEFLPAEKKQEEIAKAQKDIADNCGQ